MEPILQAKGVTKIYTTGGIQTPALQGVDLTIQKGEFTAIAGPSGSGKSTLLHLLGGSDRPTAGETWLGDRRTDQLDAVVLAHVRLWEIGFVFQAYNLIPVLTALENAAFVLELQGGPGGSGRPRRWPPWRLWTWRRMPTGAPTSFRAASSSGWPSPGPWPRSPR